MKPDRPARRAVSPARAAVSLAVAAIAAAPPVLIAQATGQTDTYTAMTVNMSVGGGESIKVNITRWSTDEERDRLASALKDRGDMHVLEAIPADTPWAGTVWTHETLGYPLRYAYRQPLPNGGQRVVLLTDRPLGSWSGSRWKAAGQDATPDYPFTLIEVRLDGHGIGSGSMSLARKVAAADNGWMIALEKFEAAPALLKNVRHRSSAASHPAPDRRSSDTPGGAAGPPARVSHKR